MTKHTTNINYEIVYLLKRALFPTLSIISPRKGEIIAEIKNGSEYRPPAKVSLTLNSLYNITPVLVVYGNTEQ
jgi:hypothetical protein